MVILLSGVRMDLIADVMDDMALPFETVACTNLKKFVGDSLAMLGHAKVIICDLDSMSDDDDGIVDSIVKVKSLYPELRLVVISEREERKALFQRLYVKGIYNLIDAQNTGDLKKAILKGMEKNDLAARFETAVPDLTAIEEKPIKQQRKEPEPEERTTEPQEEIFANKDFKQFEKNVFVGVCGVSGGVGTTHFALQTAKFLSDIGFRVCYLEATEAKKIAAIQAYPNVLRNASKGYLQYNGINIYHDFRISEVQKENYDFFVFDRGVLDEMTITAFFLCPIQILIGNGKVWSMEKLQKRVQEINNDKLSIVLNFTMAEDRAFFYGGSGIYFAAVDADPFQWKGNTEIFKKIFAKYVTVQANQSVAEPSPKRKIFSWKK